MFTATLLCAVVGDLATQCVLCGKGACESLLSMPLKNTQPDTWVSSAFDVTAKHPAH